MADYKPNEEEPRRYAHAEVEPRFGNVSGTSSSALRAVRSSAGDRVRGSSNDGHPKKYILDMFPYPSGSGLHVGHPEGYTATDILSRYYRMKGFDVLHPMGWDAFGLPAEEHAIRTNTFHPAGETQKNIAQTFKRQLKMLGFSYDWSRVRESTRPIRSYVEWTQWIFLQLYKRGLAYQAHAPVNWCPALGTVLGNEDVNEGRSKIGDHPVIRTPVRQWMLAITRYADRLLQDLALLDWPKGTVAMQTEWIGRSEGAEIRFAIGDERVGSAARSDAGEIVVFTTRPDTLFGATQVVLAPEHPRVDELTTPEHREAVRAYVTATARKSDRDRAAVVKDKTGVPTRRYFVIHPLTGQKLPDLDPRRLRARRLRAPAP